MLEKIDFKNGVVLSSKILNELQNATVFNPRFPRENYYGQPTSVDRAIWYIGERDGIKDWELSDPSLEPSTNIGRLAYDGIVLGCNNCDQAVSDLLEIVIGAPRVTYRDFDGTPLNANDPTQTKIGLFINSGSFVDSNGLSRRWNTSLVEVESGVSNYIYVDYSDTEDIIVSSNTTLPNRTSDIIPLAVVDISDSAPEQSEEERITYTDLRPGVHIYSDNRLELKNTEPVISDDYSLVAWTRTFVDTANGSVNLTLPSDPLNGDRLAVYDVSGTFDIYSPRVYSALNDQTGEPLHTILNEHTTWDLKEKYSHSVFIYYEPLSTWILEQTPVGIESREDRGEFVACGGRECIGIVPANQCVTGESIPAVFPNPSEGTYSYDTITGKCYKIIKESIGLYADGDGEFTKIFADPRCGRIVEALDTTSRKTLYVDINTGDDSLLNSGTFFDRPFRTIERALLESAKRDKPYTIKVAAGDYYVDNSPGIDSIVKPDPQSNYHNLVEITGYYVGSFNSDTNTLRISGENQVFENPPQEFTLGRTIYSRGGAFGTIVSMETLSICGRNQCGWSFVLNGVVGTFSPNERLYYNDLSILNGHKSGGIIVPNGTSIIGDNLRGTTIRPVYVPVITEEEDLIIQEDSAVFKLTSGSYISRITVSDSKEFQRSHTGLTAFVFASESDILLPYSYYQKAGALLGIENLQDEILPQIDTDIVNKTPVDYASRFEDSIENQTGRPRPDFEDGRVLSLNTIPGPIDGLGIEIPDVNSVNRGSPYVQNCAVKSIFGLNGIHADGSLVGGFKSMLASNFTVVSIQVDPVAYNGGKLTIENDPAALTSPKEYKLGAKYRHFAYKASHEGYIQANSIYTIGPADHFLSIDGGEITVTASTSNFGDTALKSQGFFPRAYTQDYATNDVGYAGTRITEIIPPKPVDYYSDRVKVDTGLNFVFDPSRVYNSTDNRRVYVRSSNNLVVFDENNPPSSESLGIYTYTYYDEDAGTHYLSGASLDYNSINIDGVDGNRYSAKIVLALEEQKTNSNSKIFKYDPAPPKEVLYELGNSYETVTNSNNKTTIAYSNSINNIGKVRPGNYLQIGSGTNAVVCNVINVSDDDSSVSLELDRDVSDLFGFSTILPDTSIVSNNITEGLWYIEIESGSIIDRLENASPNRLGDIRPLYILRDLDKRPLEDRIYRIKLEGYLANRKLRKPPENYIVLKQADLDPDGLFNPADTEPLIITNVKEVDSVNNPGQYLATLVLASDALKSTTLDLYPELNPDDLTKPNSDNLTQRAIENFISRDNILIDGVAYSDPLPSQELPYLVSNGPVGNPETLRIELRRPSLIRASSHTWEWVGYLNYDTALPRYQGLEFPPEVYLSKLSHESLGGRVFSNGMDHSGKIYLNGKEDLPEAPQLRGSEDLGGAVILSTDRPTESIYINRQLYMSLGSDLVLDNETRVQFNGPITLVDSEGNLITSQTETITGLLATDGAAGITQLAKLPNVQEYLIRGVADVSSNIKDEVITNEILHLSKASTTSYGLVTLASANEINLDSNTAYEADAVVTAGGLKTLKASTSKTGLVKLLETIDSNNHGSNNSDALTPKALFGLTASTGREGIVQLTSTVVADGDDAQLLALNSEALTGYTANTTQAGIVQLTSTVVADGDGAQLLALNSEALRDYTANTTRAGVVKLIDDIIGEGENIYDAVTPKAVHSYIDYTIGSSAIKTVNELRMSHDNNDAYVTATNSDSNNQYIYLHPVGGNIALQDPGAGNEWKIYSLSADDRVFGLDAIPIIEGGGNLGGDVPGNADKIFYLFAYTESNKIKLGASIHYPTFRDGVWVYINRNQGTTIETFRYMGKVRVYHENGNIYYKQDLGGRITVNSVIPPANPTIGLVNFQNKVSVILKYIIDVDIPSPDTPHNLYHPFYQEAFDNPNEYRTDFGGTTIEADILTAENSLVRGRLTAINYFYRNSNNDAAAAVTSVFPEITEQNVENLNDVNILPHNPLDDEGLYHTAGLTGGQRTIMHSDFEFPTYEPSDPKYITVKYATKYWTVADGAVFTDISYIVYNDGAQSLVTVNTGMIIETEV